MSVAEKLERRIKRIQEGTTFTYQLLGIEQAEYIAAAKAIERLIKRGVIRRVSSGIFYKPKQSVFGELPPQETELLKPYLFEDGKRIAYITGVELYNRMGLTTQVPNTVKVASRAKRITARIGKMQIKPVKSYVDVSNDNFRLLEILDAMKDFKVIPDVDKKSAIRVLQSNIKALSANDRSRIVRYAIKYPPRAMALLGAIMESTATMKDLDKLKAKLNPLSTYDIGITPDALPTAPNWNIH